MSQPLHLCYLNGEYLPLAAARVSPLDRGFFLGGNRSAWFQPLLVGAIDFGGENLFAVDGGHHLR